MDLTMLPTPSVDLPPDPQKGIYRTRLIDATKLLDEIGWGNQGDVSGIEEDIPIRELRENPWNKLEYSPAQIDAMTGSLQTMGQLEAVQTIYIEHPGTDDDGFELGHHLVIDGHLRLYGARAADWDHLRAKVRPWHSLTQTMLEFGTTKASVRPLSGWELGAIILSIRAAYEDELAYCASHNIAHPLKRFYTQKELARRLGCAQPTVNHWLQIASQPEPIVELLRLNRLNSSQVLELIQRYANPEARTTAAVQIADQPHLPAKTIRGTKEPVFALPVPPIQWSQDAVTTVQVGDLWSVDPPQETMPVPVILGRALHDIEHCLAIGGLPADAQSLVKRLQTFLKMHEVQLLIQSVAPHLE